MFNELMMEKIFLKIFDDFEYDILYFLRKSLELHAKF